MADRKDRTPAGNDFSLLDCRLFALSRPGLLWWVNRKLQRPIWLLAVFPLVAAMLTLGIFFYAFIHDGVGLHGRLRSITVASVAAGEACAYSRQTYFSGFPPRQVNFNPKSEVWSIRSEHEEQATNHYNSRASSTLGLSEDAQSFSGLITSRDQKQWIVTTPVGNFRPFKWKEIIDGAIDLQYLLSERCLLGVWIDDDKQVWVVEDLASCSTGKPRKTSIDEAKKLITEKLPIDVYPVGYVDHSNQSLFDWFDSNRYRYRNNYANLGVGNAGIESLPNEWIQKKLAEPRNFILFLERGSHIDRPCGDRVIESDGSHIVIGTW